MLSLYPANRKRLIITCIGFPCLAILLYVLFPEMPAFTAIVGVLGTLLLFFVQYSATITQHNQLLSRLYYQLDARGFIDAFEPKLALPLRNANVRLMAVVHLSNAYCALGEFDRAVSLLLSIPLPEGDAQQPVLFRYSVMSNLCYCYEQQGDIAAAGDALHTLLDLRRRLETLQEKKPQAKRAVFSTVLNEQCYALLTGASVDIAALRKLVKANTQPLHQVTTNLWIGRAYLAQNDRREAENALRSCVKLAPHLYPGIRAKALLSELPERSTDGKNRKK